MFDTIHLTNMLRSEVEGIPETGLPLDAFPDKIQEIILNLARYENFNVEYTASIILSAVATAIGNSCHIRIKMCIRDRCCRQGQSVRRCPYHRIRPSSGSVYPICPMFAAANDER